MISRTISARIMSCGIIDTEQVTGIIEKQQEVERIRRERIQPLIDEIDGINREKIDPMEKLKPYLLKIQQHHFWILIVIAIVARFYAWSAGTAELEKSFQKNKLSNLKYAVNKD